ncbi:hypothetical protein Btru_013621 [Bulinus truncatus]|nr:hypothetical protein Btru_013621 [Bulinus truncatus]
MLTVTVNVWNSQICLLLIYISVVLASVCPPNWMGPKCRFKCNCQKECLPSGECAENDLCKMPYFGYACQYYDVTYNQTQVEPALTDWNDSTCNTGSGESVQITLAQGRISFIRLMTKQPAAVHWITLTLADQPNANCEYGNYSVLIQANVKEIYCKTRSNVSRITLAGHGVSFLCSVHIGTGRNVALKTPVSYTSLIKDGDGLAGVDGEYPTSGAPDTKTCFQSDSPVQNFTYFVLFPLPMTIDRFVLINSPEISSSSQKAVNFELKTFDEKNKTIMSFMSNDALGQRVYVIQHTAADVSVQAFHIELKDSTASVQFCEIEAYGDCLPGSYGLDCSKNCSSKCTDKFCLLNGRCRACQDGYYGENCDQVCSDGCAGSGVCSKAEGDCVSGCLTGFYHSTCTLECSNCYNNGNCSMDDGHCYDGCKEGYFGPNCTSECSPGTFGINCSGECHENCKTNCSSVTGECIVCKTGMHGKSCTLVCSENCVQGACHVGNGSCQGGCKSGFYASDCTRECSKNCGETGACDSFDGHCKDGCKKGFYDYGCIKVCSKYCVNEEICDQNDGTCPNGCVIGFSGNDCKTECSPRCGGNKSCDPSTGKCQNGCVDGYGGDHCNSSCGNCADGMCDQNSLRCLRGCNDGYHGTSCTLARTLSGDDDEDSGTSTAAVVIAAVGLCVIVAIILLKKKAPIPLVTE